MLSPRRSRPGAPARLPQIEDRYRLGDVGAGVSPVCLGMVRDPRVVPAAFDAGINFFFLSADMHWPLYEPLRQGLATLLARGGDVRDRIVVAVVSYVTQPEFCHAPFHEAVDAVPGLGHADVTIAGGAYAHDLLARLAEYRKHRERAPSLVRATGASFHDRGAAREAIRHDLVDLAYVRYNPLHRGAEEDLFPRLPPSGRTLLYNFKSSGGYLTEDRYRDLGLSPGDWRPSVTDYYRFALGRPEVDGLLCSLDTERHVAELAEALAEGPLDEESAGYLRDLGDLAAGRAQLAVPSPT